MTAHDPRASRSAPHGTSYLAVAVFAASVAYWAYRYFVAFGRPVIEAWPSGRALAWNVGLFAAFALHHSLLARPALRNIVERRWPGRERAIFVIVSSALLALVCAWWQPVPGGVWHASGAVAHAVAVMRVAAFGWIGAAARVLDLSDLVGLRPSTMVGADARAPVFRAEGPYAVVRHPLYTGWLVVVFGLPSLSMTQLSFAACSTAYILLGLELEERTLRSGPAGNAYREYARQVPAKLVPFVY